MWSGHLKIYAGNFLQDSPNYHSLTPPSIIGPFLKNSCPRRDRTCTHVTFKHPEKYNNAAQLHSNHLNGLFQRAHQQHTSESCYINQLCNWNTCERITWSKWTHTCICMRLFWISYLFAEEHPVSEKHINYHISFRAAAFKRVDKQSVFSFSHLILTNNANETAADARE